MRKLFLLSALLMACLFNITSMSSQVPTATLSGLVKDSKGAVVQGAYVKAINGALGSVRESLSNDDGTYSLPNLLPGRYSVVASFSGFATVEYPTVLLEAGRTQTLDVDLTPAAQSMTVQVSAATQSVDLAQSMIQGQITSSTIQSIPLNGRNFLELAFLVPRQSPRAHIRSDKDKYPRSQFVGKRGPRWKHDRRRRR